MIVARCSISLLEDTGLSKMRIRKYNVQKIALEVLKGSLPVTVSATSELAALKAARPAARPSGDIAPKAGQGLGLAVSPAQKSADTNDAESNSRESGGDGEGSVGSDSNESIAAAVPA